MRFSESSREIGPGGGGGGGGGGVALGCDIVGGKGVGGTGVGGTGVLEGGAGVVQASPPKSA